MESISGVGSITCGPHWTEIDDDRFNSKNAEWANRCFLDDADWRGFRFGANANGIVLQRQQLTARQQSAIRHLLSGGGDDHRGHHLYRGRHCYVGTTRIAFNLEVHYRRGLFRIWRYLCGDLRL